MTAYDTGFLLKDNGTAAAASVADSAYHSRREDYHSSSLFCGGVPCDYYLDRADEIWTDFKEEKIGKITWKVYKGEIEEYGCKLHGKAEKDCFSRWKAGDTGWNDPTADLYKRVSGHVKDTTPFNKQGPPAKNVVQDAGEAMAQCIANEAEIKKNFFMAGPWDVKVPGLRDAKIWYNNGGASYFGGDSILEGGLWNMEKTAGGLKYVATATFNHNFDPEEAMTRLYRPRCLHHVTCLTKDMGKQVMDVAFEQRLDILYVATKGFRGDFVGGKTVLTGPTGAMTPRPSPVVVMKKSFKHPSIKNEKIHCVVMKTIKADKDPKTDRSLLDDYGNFKDCMILRMRGYAFWKEDGATRVAVFSHEDPGTDYYNVASSVYSRLSFGQQSGGAWESAKFQLERLVHVAPAGGKHGLGSIFDTHVK
jgi:hypothetical protein